MGCDIAAGSLCPGTLACCSNLCIDTSMDLSNCGACGRPCNAANVATPSCSANLCAPVCLAGWADCNHPIAPAADDGCETNVYNVAHCGSCSNVCSLPNATPACPSGTCTIASCSGGFFDCDAQAPNGCECAGKDLGDGMKGCCPAGTCQTGHSDGFGHNFTDCIAFGTYSAQLAMDASNAYNLPGATESFCDTTNCVGASYYCTRRRQGSMTKECVCWAFNGASTGFAKHVSAECLAPMTTDVAWK
jgi:hypothetical protein